MTGDRDTRPFDDRTAGWVDLALAGAVAALVISSVVSDDPTVPDELFAAPPSLVPVVLLAAMASLPLALRRRWPLPVHVVVLVSVGLLGALHWPMGLTAACLMVSLYTVAAWRPWAVAVAALVLQYAVTGMLGLLQAPYFADTQGQLATFGYLIAWVVGLVVRRGRAERAAAVARAMEAERVGAVEAERAAFAERLRLARELHDVVSHSLSVIAIQSAAAQYVIHRDPESATRSLAEIESASRVALDDLRRMLGALRSGLEDPDAELAPAPGLDELELLVAAHRAADRQVDLHVDPDMAEIPDSVRLTVVRIVQEALTNVRKHAPEATVRVEVERDGSDVVVTVDDDGPGRVPVPTAGPGFGLTGMRERVALFGGSLEAAPKPGGGFLVRARIAAGPR